MPRLLRRRPRRRPRLDIDAPAGGPRAVVVLVPGGPVRGFGAMPRWDVSYLRMLPFGAAVRRVSDGRVAVVTLRHRQSGWNGPQETVLAEARWALADIGRRFPGVPLGLVGHSRGGRIVLRLAADPRVGAAVALAPWVPAGEPLPQVGGGASDTPEAAEAPGARGASGGPDEAGGGGAGSAGGVEMLVVQGTADVVCPARDTDAYVERARAAGLRVRYVRLPCVGHAFAVGAARTHAEVARYVTDRLLSQGDPRS